jgi:hypothetical protein
VPLAAAPGQRDDARRASCSECRGVCLDATVVADRAPSSSCATDRPSSRPWWTSRPDTSPGPPQPTAVCHTRHISTPESPDGCYSSRAKCRSGSELVNWSPFAFPSRKAAERAANDRRRQPDQNFDAVPMHQAERGANSKDGPNHASNEGSQHRTPVCNTTLLLLHPVISTAGNRALCEADRGRLGFGEVWRRPARSAR